jgi:hypothetical protein
MFILKYHHFGILHTIESESYEEILEQCLNVLHSDCEPQEVLEDEKIILTSVEIYNKFNKRYY